MKILVNSCKVSLVISTLLVGVLVSTTPFAAIPCQGKSCYYTSPASKPDAPSATSKERCMIGCKTIALKPCAGRFITKVNVCKTAALAAPAYQSCVAACK